MKVAFVTNVGSRDVQVEGHPNLPTDSRTLGEAILKDWETYKPHVRMPILMKALDSVLRRHSEVDEIILFASDQPESSRYRHTDTLPFAQVVERYVGEEQGDDVRDVMHIEIIDGNPSDYDEMMSYYASVLTRLTNYDIVYLQVSGGTPAMSFMLLWQGVEVLAEKAQPLYVIQEHKTPLSLNIGHTLIVNALIDDLSDNLRVYQYHAAISLMKKNEAMLRRRLSTYDTIYKLIDHARWRGNFRFEEAEQALIGADQHVGSTETKTILSLSDALVQFENTQLLCEEYFAVEVDIETGDFRSVLFHVFAYIEAFQRLSAVKQGVRMSDKGKLDMNWLNTKPKLKQYLESKDVKFDRGANTFTLDLILSFFAKADPELAATKKIMSRITNNLRDLRNEMTHKHGGVSLAAIESEYKGTLAGLLEEMRGLYETLTDEAIPENPYRQVNALVSRLIETSK